MLLLSTVLDAVNTGRSYTLIADSTGGTFRIEGDTLVVANTLLLDNQFVPASAFTIRMTDINGNSYDETFALTVTDAAVERRLVASDEPRSRHH